MHCYRRWRPGRFGDPPSRQFLVIGRRPHAVGHPRAQHRLVHHAGVDALQPMIPPPQRLLQEADLRTGERDMRIGMRPGPDETLARHRQVFEQTRDRIGVAVGPAADREDRTLDRAVILAHRAVLPVVVAPLMPQPGRQEQGKILQPLQPHRPPAIADERGVGRMAHRAEQERGPAEAGAQHRAAHEVHVVAIAVVGRADRDDRLQRRRAARGDLQRVEPAPGDPHHADRAAAPRLRRQPRDHLQRVVLLLPGVFVEQQPVRTRRCRGYRRAPRHSRGRRDTDASARRDRRCRCACGTAGTRGSPAPGSGPHPPAARCGPPISCRRAAGSACARSRGRHGGSR